MPDLYLTATAFSPLQEVPHKSLTAACQQVLEQVYKQVEKYNFLGRDAAKDNIIPKLTITCIFTTETGTLRAYGAAVCVGLLNRNQVSKREAEPQDSVEFARAGKPVCSGLKRRISYRPEPTGGFIGSY